jgi:hypothetical protein
MYTIEMEKECGCFKKSGFESTLTFDTREDMINKARVLECRMNQEFCMKHFFEAVDYGDKIVIHSSERPQDDDDDELETEDANTLVRNSKVMIGFNAKEEPPHGSNSN